MTSFCELANKLSWLPCAIFGILIPTVEWKACRLASFPDSIGPYRVLSQVGEGSMGIVLKAQDQRLNRTVALKLIRSRSSDPSQRQRFWQEARAAAQVTHPNACRLY